jgi:AcrR family transcriptional regulator
MRSVAERRTQEERRAATRAALLAAGRRLFASEGYEAVSSEQIVAAAGVTRGALYHHFDGKRGLFAEVFEQVEAELAGRFDLGGLESTGPLDVLLVSVDQFLELSLEAEVQRIALLDGPAVLGWEAWHEVERRYGLALIEAGLSAAMEAGEIRRLPVAELSLMLLGAFTEAALQLARADDPDAAKARATTAMRGLIEGLRAQPPQS